MTPAARLRWENIPYIAPPEAPRWCRTLSMNEAEARGIIQPGHSYSIGPAGWVPSGRWVAAVRCNGPGQPFAVLNGRDGPGGIFMRWHAAAAFMVQIAREYEAEDLAQRRAFGKGRRS